MVEDGGKPAASCAAGGARSEQPSSSPPGTAPSVDLRQPRSCFCPPPRLFLCVSQETLTPAGWGRSRRQDTQMPLRLTIATLMSHIETEWTLNASLTRLNSYGKCSKRRILGHSAQATSLPPIEGTTKCSRTALGFVFGSISGFAAGVKPKAVLGFRASPPSRLETDSYAGFAGGSRSRRSPALLKSSAFFRLVRRNRGGTPARARLPSK
jgi:hypothetical protein